MVWVEEERQEKHEIKRLKYVDSICDAKCNAQDQFKSTALTQKIMDKTVKKKCGTFSNIHSSPQHSKHRDPTFPQK